MPLLTKYHNPRPVAEGGGQSSPVSDLTPAWPFVMRFTARTKESQWSLVTGFRAIRLSQHVSRGGVIGERFFPGQGSAKMPHARSSVTWTSAILDDSRACAPLHLGKGAISSPLMGGRIWLRWWGLTVAVKPLVRNWVVSSLSNFAIVVSHKLAYNLAMFLKKKHAMRRRPEKKRRWARDRRAVVTVIERERAQTPGTAAEAHPSIRESEPTRISPPQQ